LLLCFHYDPLTGRYGLAIIRLIRGVSIAFVLGLVWYVASSVRRELRQRGMENRAHVSTSNHIATDSA
jgi:hypothetical protein